jgi:hypothetical protein
MVLKSISIPHETLVDAFATLTRLGLKAGRDTTIEVNGTVTIMPGAIDRMVEAYLSSDRMDTPATPAQRPTPHRRDRRLDFPAWAETRLLQHHRAFIQAMADADDDSQAQRRALENWQNARRQMRLNIIHEYAQGDVVHGNTYCYGGDLNGAHQLDTPTGEIIRCDRLIHYTHPVNPEDLWLREASVWCREIYRYHIPGLDDGPWQTQNEPLQQLYPDSYRELLVARC